MCERFWTLPIARLKREVIKLKAERDILKKAAAYTEEQIIAILKEHEAGMKTADLCCKHEISGASFYNWKAKYAGLRSPRPDLTTRQARCAATSLRSRQPIHQRADPEADGRSRYRLFDEPFRQRLGQCGNGELLLVAEDRAHGPQDLSDT
jgi:hypothetical protein